MLGDKLRFRFEKTGTLRLLSHLDLARSLERMLRRAALPFKSTAGFHPGPRLVFALSLPLGVVGREEVLELELTEPRDAEDVRAALNAQAPAGLAFTSAAVVPMKATAVPRRIVYRVELPPDRVAETEARAAALLAQDKVWVERLRPNPKRLNVRPYLRALGVDGTTLSLDLWVTQTGTARADELLRLLGLGDLPDGGAVLERTCVEIRDEVPAADAVGRPPDGPADTLPLDLAAVGAAAREPETQPAEAHWGASPSGPVVE
jgi:radical SAM-linked protein